MSTLARLLQAVADTHADAGRRVSGTDSRGDSPRGPIMLLAGQGFALGLTMAWILISASAIFLAAYGSDLLPVTYIGAAGAGLAAEHVALGGVS